MQKTRVIATSAVALVLALGMTGCNSNSTRTDDASSAGESAPATAPAASTDDAEKAEEAQEALVRIDTEGMGVISWAYEDAEPEFDDDTPYQSAYVSDAYGQTIHIEARDYEEYEGWHFAEWMKDDEPFSTENRIDVPVDGDAHYVAVFEMADGGIFVDYGESQIYTQEDIDAAIDVIMAEVDTWTGAVMNRLELADDETCTADLEYCNSLRDDGAPEFDQAIVFNSKLHSPSGEDAEGTAWEPDTDYYWTWHLARTDGGDWQLLTWGY